MNRRSSNRHNPFRNQGNNQQNDQNSSQSHNRPFNGPSGSSHNQGNRSYQQNDFQQDAHHSPQSNNRSFNGAANDSTPSPPQSQAPRSGPCVLCKSATVLICSRCGDFYCSPTCQKTDWQTHRFICFLMPKLVSSSTDIYQNIPALNGYQNRELPETVSNNVQSQNRKWISNSPNSPTPSSAPMQNNQSQRYQNQQQQQQPNYQQNQNNRNQQQQQQQNPPNQRQQRQQNRQTPPRSTVNGSERSLDHNDANKATNIGRVEQAPFPKNNSNVLVSAIRSSNRVFIRSIDKEENEGFCNVIKAINEYGRNATPLKTMPTKNAFAITDFNNDGLFYRVQVVSAKDENNIHVIYFDFGNEDVKKLSELKDISMQCASLKQYVVMVTLKGVPFIKDNPKIVEYMKSFEDIEAKILYNEREKPICEIVLDGVEDSLNKKVNIYIQKSKNESEQQQSQPTQQVQEEPRQPARRQEQVNTPSSVGAASTVGAGKPLKSRPSQFSKPVMVPPFEQIILPIKATNINVMIVDNSLLHFNCFGCVLVEDKANLQEIQNYLNDYEDNGREYKPKIEEYCLAKFQDGWYRAKVLDVLSAKFVEVVFIDFLNESEVEIKDIRRYPMDLDLPCKTTLCLIQGLANELTENQVEYLKNKLQPGSEIKINEVVEKHPDGSGIAVCKVNQINQWMAEDNP
ncbi:TPR-containing protein DDB_G0280363-like [Episyrphus balteatus]|uniref:TPR-containing protein DDB_G0280363-like n=1 Tax=Episyrphus balteatus TaxID=286459 RepID=UPI0024860B7B|nr:TPR-containing protein DDB_G0280363-like [Episyrphus balteatus]